VGWFKVGSAAAARKPRANRSVLALALIAALVAGADEARAEGCNSASPADVAAALAQIEHSIDPCGETTVVEDVLDD
jgi:hypothetical protein